MRTLLEYDFDLNMLIESSDLPEESEYDTLYLRTNEASSNYLFQIEDKNNIGSFEFKAGSKIGFVENYGIESKIEDTTLLHLSAELKFKVDTVVETDMLYEDGEITEIRIPVQFQSKEDILVTGEWFKLKDEELKQLNADFNSDYAAVFVSQV
jgi:hypothetical protein